MGKVVRVALLALGLTLGVLAFSCSGSEDGAGQDALMNDTGRSDTLDAGDQSGGGGMEGTSEPLQSNSLGDGRAGFVHCAEQSCELVDGVVCCLWLVGDPPVPKHGCTADCAMIDSIECDGAEDCDGNACCNGRCTQEAECAGGHGDWCHDASTCPEDRSECQELRSAWGTQYGICLAPMAE